MEAALGLDNVQWSQFLGEVHARRAETPHLSRREEELLAVINAPDDTPKRAKLEAMQDLAHERLLDEEEERDLLELVNWNECDWAKRLDAILKLARLRGIPATEMMKQLGLERTLDEVRVR